MPKTKVYTDTVLINNINRYDTANDTQVRYRNRYDIDTWYHRSYRSVTAKKRTGGAREGVKGKTRSLRLYWKFDIEEISKTNVRYLVMGLPRTHLTNGFLNFHYSTARRCQESKIRCSSISPLIEQHDSCTPVQKHTYTRSTQTVRGFTPRTPI